MLSGAGGRASPALPGFPWAAAGPCVARGGEQPCPGSARGGVPVHPCVPLRGYTFSPALRWAGRGSCWGSRARAAGPAASHMPELLVTRFPVLFLAPFPEPLFALASLPTLPSEPTRCQTSSYPKGGFPLASQSLRPDPNKSIPTWWDQQKSVRSLDAVLRRVSRGQSLHQQTTSGLLLRMPPKRPLQPGLRHRSPVLTPARLSPHSAWFQPAASARRLPLRLQRKPLPTRIRRRLR